MCLKLSLLKCHRFSQVTTCFERYLQFSERNDHGVECQTANTQIHAAHQNMHRQMITIVAIIKSYFQEECSYK